MPITVYWKMKLLGWKMKLLRPHPAALATLTLSLLAAGCRHTPTDSDLTGGVQARLSGDPAISAEPIQTSVQAGVATLDGNVSSQAARSLAAADAAAVPGIRTVVNNLTVTTAAANVPPANPEPLPPPAADVPAPAPSRTEAAHPNARERAAQARTDRAAQARAERARKTTPPSNQPSAPINDSQQAALNTPPAPAPTPTAPPPPPAPVLRNITIPAGTVLPIRITQTLDSATTQQGDSFSGSLSSDVTVEGATVLRQGANVSGRVTAVQEAAHFKGNSLLTIELTGLTRRGDRIALSTDPYSAQGKGRGKNTAEKVGGGAAVGAILGGIFGGGKGAAIGAAGGGGLGAGAQAITKGQQVQIPAESLLRFRLANPITVRVSSTDATPRTAPTDASPADTPPTNPGEARRPLPN